ncbi:AraC-like DNA-binding protein [Acinetobacter calcoaceticus]|uniref:AraC-like DNA-binding protein n=1 Tax=Acinetobacter calcoaceticus TaxID=471 RepID=A0A4R1XZK3_ACICA|nr:AraC-like DNA-binding protein [Acinetobacter calcoaceticus]
MAMLRAASMGAITIKTEFADYKHLKELGGLELLKARYRHTQFSKHVHEGYCIGIIEDGAQAFYRNGQLHTAPKGDIILVNADEIHTGSSAVESGWRYRAIYPTPEMLSELTQDIFTAKGAAPWFPHAVVHDPGLAQQFSILLNLLDQEHDQLLKETLYLSTIACLILRHGRQQTTPQPLANAEKHILNIKAFIAANYSEDISLTELAQMAGLSPWHFLRQFKKYVGLTPHNWLVQIRLQQARMQLKYGDPIIEVAQNCGFSDQSHLNRHFKRAMGITPAQYLSDFQLAH